MLDTITTMTASLSHTPGMITCACLTYAGHNHVCLSDTHTGRYHMCLSGTHRALPHVLVWHTQGITTCACLQPSNTRAGSNTRVTLSPGAGPAVQAQPRLSHTHHENITPSQGCRLADSTSVRSQGICDEL
ncbi:hypothetical protein BsWGS_22134 [Bradybaena similaris]